MSNQLGNITGVIAGQGAEAITNTLGSLGTLDPQKQLFKLRDLQEEANKEGGPVGGMTIDQINAQIRELETFFAGKKADAVGEKDEEKDTSVADKVTELEGLLKPIQTDTGGIREDLLGGEDLPSTFDLSAAITAAKGAG